MLRRRWLYSRCILEARGGGLEHQVYCPSGAVTLLGDGDIGDKLLGIGTVEEEHCVGVHLDTAGLA